MSEILTALIVDAESGESIERPLNKNEIKDREIVISQDAKRNQELENNTKLRESALGKLKKLGLTEAEIAAL
jgi:hypothetical protein